MGKKQRKRFEKSIEIYEDNPSKNDENIKLPVNKVITIDKIIIDLKNKLINILCCISDWSFNSFDQATHPEIYINVTRLFDILTEFINGPCIENQKLLHKHFTDGDMDLVISILKKKTSDCDNP